MPYFPLIHHSNSPSLYVWERYATELAAAGEYVLTYDLYGRGTSAAVTVDHTLPLFIGQLAELLLAVSVETDHASSRPIYLVGQSMGSAVSVGFTQVNQNWFLAVLFFPLFFSLKNLFSPSHFPSLFPSPFFLPSISFLPFSTSSLPIPQVYPQLVQRLVLMAPAGLKLKPLAIIAALTKLTKSRGTDADKSSALADHDSSAGYYDPSLPENVAHQAVSKKFLDEQVKVNPKYWGGILNTLQNFPLGTMNAEYEALGKQKVAPSAGAAPAPRPTLVIWGKSDEVTPYDNHNTLLKYIPQAQLVSIDQSKHVDHLVTKYPVAKAALYPFLGVKGYV